MTLALCLGEDEWNGYTKISDLLDLPDERLKPYTLDYEINLVSPPEMEDEEFTKFKTELRLALQGLKHQGKGFRNFSRAPMLVDLQATPMDRTTYLAVSP